MRVLIQICSAVKEILVFQSFRKCYKAMLSEWTSKKKYLSPTEFLDGVVFKAFLLKKILTANTLVKRYFFQ